MRKKIILFLILPFIIVLFSSSERNFSLVFNKVGVTEFYFTEPNNPGTVKRDAIVFPLDNSPVSVGVYWSLYPSGSSSERLNLTIEFSAENNIDPGSKFMLQDREGVNGFNYIVSRSSQAGLQPSDYMEKMNQDRRTLSLFSGTVSTAGASGSETITLTIPDTNYLGVKDGTYRGYLIMSLTSVE